MTNDHAVTHDDHWARFSMTNDQLPMITTHDPEEGVQVSFPNNVKLHHTGFLLYFVDSGMNTIE